MTDLTQASARGVAWNLVQNLGGKLLGLVVVAVLARFLDRAAFGTIALGLTVTAFAELVVSQGYGEFITQRADLTPEQIDTAFWLNGALGLTLTGIIILGAQPIASLLGEPSVAYVVRWLALSLLIRSFSVVPAGLLVRRMQFRSLSMRSLVAAAIGGGAGIVAAHAGLGIYSLIIQTLLGDVAAAVALWGATEWRPGWRFSREAVGELTAFGAPVFFATVLNFGSRRLDSVIIASTLGVTTLGTYYMAQRMFQIANQVLNKSGDAVTLSALSRLADSVERRRDAFYKVTELTCALCFPLYALLAVLAGPAIAVIFGAKWLDGAPVLAAFAISGLPISLSYLNAAALKALARTRLYLVVHIILLAVYLPLLLAIVGYGPRAAALAYGIACAVIVPVEVWLVREAMAIRLATYLRHLLGPSLATAASVGVTVLAGAVNPVDNPLFQLVFGGIVGVLAYAVSLRVLAASTFRRFQNVVRATLARSRPV